MRSSVLCVFLLLPCMYSILLSYCHHPLTTSLPHPEVFDILGPWIIDVNLHLPLTCNKMDLLLAGAIPKGRHFGYPGLRWIPMTLYWHCYVCTQESLQIDGISFLEEVPSWKKFPWTTETGLGSKSRVSILCSSLICMSLCWCCLLEVWRTWQFSFLIVICSLNLLRSFSQKQILTFSQVAASSKGHLCLKNWTSPLTAKTIEFARWC